MSEIAHPAPDGWLKRFFLSLVILALLAGLLLVPWAVCWLTASGELDQEEVVARQAQGEFVLFGPGLAPDIMAYKLALYAAVKPEVVVLGSSRAGNVRAAFFERPFLNMAGAATDLESLRLLVDRMLAVHRPRVVLLGLDFWWLTAGAPAGHPERIVQPSLIVPAAIALTAAALMAAASASFIFTLDILLDFHLQLKSAACLSFQF